MRSYDEALAFFESELLPEIEQHRRAVLLARQERSAAAISYARPVAILFAGLVLDVLAGGVGLWMLGLGVAVYTSASDVRRDFFGPSRLSRVPHFDAKQRIIGRTVRFLDPGIEYQARSVVPEYVLRDSGLCDEPYDRYGGEDRIRGKLGATLFDLSEIRLDRRFGDETKRVFTGMLFCADFNKEFTSSTWLLPDASEKHLGMIGRALQNLARGGRRGELVQLASPEFERLFRVYSTDETEARYLLSPSLMRRLLELAQNVSAPMRVSLVGGRIYVLIEHDANLFQPVSAMNVDASVFRRWLGEVIYTTSLVEDLDLNTRIWSKAPEPERGFHEGPEPDERGSGGVGAGGGVRINPAAFTHRRQPGMARARPSGPLMNAALSGNISLGKAVLLFGFLGGTVVSHASAGLAASGTEPSTATVVGALAMLPIYFILWRNAPNTQRPFWTWVVRAGVALALLSSFGAAATIIGLGELADPGSTLPPREPTH